MPAANIPEFELILPAYNEAASLPTVISATVQAAIRAGFSPDRFQLVIVDNGSRDASSDVLQRESKGSLGSWFRVVTVPVNQGYGHGIWSDCRRRRRP